MFVEKKVGYMFGTCYRPSQYSASSLEGQAKIKAHARDSDDTRVTPKMNFI